MKRFALRAAWALFGIVLLFAVGTAGCTPTQMRDFQSSTPGKVIDCGSSLISRCGPQTLPLVNACLAVQVNPVPCIMGVIGTAECAREDVVACVVKHSGSTAAASAELNGDDVVSLRMASNAREVIRQRGWVFSR